MKFDPFRAVYDRMWRLRNPGANAVKVKKWRLCNLKTARAISRRWKRGGH